MRFVNDTVDLQINDMLCLKLDYGVICLIINELH